MSRPKKKNYDPEAVMKTLISAIDEVYRSTGEIKATAVELNLAELKVKKLLITSKVIVYPVTEEIQDLLRRGKRMDEIQDQLCLSRASINSYLPYSKIPYKESEISANADRCELYRKRKAAVEEIDDIESLWNAIVLFAGYPFHTATGLPFKYEIRKGRDGEYTRELWIDRRDESKSLTMSTVERAYRKSQELKGSIVDRPKALGDLRGVSYIYSIFYRFGLIDVPEKVKEKMNFQLLCAKISV